MRFKDFSAQYELDNMPVSYTHKYLEEALCELVFKEDRKLSPR